MLLTHDFRETIKALLRLEPGFREAVLIEAIGALVRGEVRVGTVLASLGSETDAELLQRLEDEADIAILRERLADDDVSGYIPHAEVAADVNA